MSLITGHGAPGTYTAAEAGELYSDLDTGQIYICRGIYQQTPNLISDVKTEYRWKVYRRVSWDEVLDMLVEIDAIPALAVNDSILSVDENILIV